MKYLVNALSILSLVFVLSGCAGEAGGTGNEETQHVDLKQIALTHLSSNIENIKGAEFIGMDVLDTMEASEFLEREIIIYSRPLENKEARLTNVNTAINVARTALDTNPDDEAAKKSYNSAVKQKTNIELNQARVDSLQFELSKLAPGSINYYEILMKYSRKDEEGNVKPENYNLRISANGTILNYGKTKQKNNKSK